MRLVSHQVNGTWRFGIEVRGRIADAAEAAERAGWATG